MLRNIIKLVNTCHSLYIKGEEHVVKCIGYERGGFLRFHDCGSTEITTSNPYLKNAKCGICSKIPSRKCWTNKFKKLDDCTSCRSLEYTKRIPSKCGKVNFCINCFMCSRCYSCDNLAYISYTIRDDIFYSSPEQRIFANRRFTEYKLYCYGCRKYSCSR